MRGAGRTGCSDADADSDNVQAGIWWWQTLDVLRRIWDTMMRRGAAASVVLQSSLVFQSGRCIMTVLLLSLWVTLSSWLWCLIESPAKFCCVDRLLTGIISTTNRAPALTTVGGLTIVFMTTSLSVQMLIGSTSTRQPTNTMLKRTFTRVPLYSHDLTCPPFRP